MLRIGSTNDTLKRTSLRIGRGEVVTIAGRALDSRIRLFTSIRWSTPKALGVYMLENDACSHAWKVFAQKILHCFHLFVW